MQLSKLLLISLLIISGTIPDYSQTVYTLVPGVSTFNDGLALDRDGNIYASYFYSTTVTKITPAGATSIFATGFDDPNGLTFDSSGLLYVTNAGADRIDTVTQDGQVGEYLSVTSPAALKFDKQRNLYIASYNTNSISILDTAGIISIFWSGGLLNGPIGLEFDDENNLYVGNFTDGKVFKRTPAGDITEIGDIPGWLGFMTRSGDDLYATAYQQNKIYKVPMDGSGQSEFAGTGAAGQNDGPVNEATFNNPNGIVATSTGDTLYISDYTPRSLRMITGVNTTTDFEDDDATIKSFKLQQNYPNPFNPVTNIQYVLGSPGFVSLKVYDVLGKEVASLVDEVKQTGRYEIQFSASDFISGIYFYSLRSGNYFETRKMILLK